MFRVFLISPVHNTPLSSSACPVLVIGSTTYFQLKDFTVLCMSLQSDLFQAIVCFLSLCKKRLCFYNPSCIIKRAETCVWGYQEGAGYLLWIKQTEQGKVMAKAHQLSLGKISFFLTGANFSESVLGTFRQESSISAAKLFQAASEHRTVLHPGRLTDSQLWQCVLRLI